MTKGQRTRLIVFAILLLAIIIGVSTVLTQTQYAVLYSGMDPKDAGTVMARLQALNVEAKTQGTDTILVPTEQADQLRMQLASEGLPENGFNNDIFKQGSGLGTTDMEKNFYKAQQLQVNLAKTIKQMEKVDDAIVNLNLGQSSSFVLSSNNIPATASVLLKLKNGVKLNDNEVRAVAELVSKGVGNLDIKNVSIQDTKMNLYTIKDPSSTAVDMGSQYELQNSVQDRLQEQVQKLLEPVFGQGKVIAQVNAVLDFDKQSTQSTIFSPPVAGSDTGIAISMKELAETVQNGASGGVPGISGNGGGITYPTVTGGDTVYNQISRETNMEVNETKTQIDKAQGTIKDLSVAVILDSNTVIQDYSDDVSSLVAGAIGVDKTRVTVKNMPINAVSDSEFQAAKDGQVKLADMASSTSTVNTVIIAVAIVACALILMGILITLFRKPKARQDQYQYATAGAGASGGSVEYMADEEVMPDPAYENIDLNTKNNNIQQVEKFIDKSPEAVAQLLRNWLSE